MQRPWDEIIRTYTPVYVSIENLFTTSLMKIFALTHTVTHIIHIIWLWISTVPYFFMCAGFLNAANGTRTIKSTSFRNTRGMKLNSTPPSPPQREGWCGSVDIKEANAYDEDVRLHFRGWFHFISFICQHRSVFDDVNFIFNLYHHKCHYKMYHCYIRWYVFIVVVFWWSKIKTWYSEKILIWDNIIFVQPKGQKR